MSMIIQDRLHRASRFWVDNGEYALPGDLERFADSEIAAFIQRVERRLANELDTDDEQTVKRILQEEK